MFTLSFELEYHGWLNIQIQNDTDIIEIPASFLSDSITDLTSSLSSFADSAKEVVILFETEPGEYRFRFIELDKSFVFEIWDFDETFSSEELKKGIMILSYKTHKKYDLLKPFYQQLIKLYDLGEVEYFRLWNYAFPMEAFERLTRKMKIL